MSKTISIKHFLQTSLAVEHLLEEKNGISTGFVRCDIKVPKNLRTKFADFLPSFKNTLVGKSDIVNGKVWHRRKEKFLNHRKG